MFKKYFLSILLLFVFTRSFSQIYNTGTGDGYAISCAEWNVQLVLPVTYLRMDVTCSAGGIIVQWAVASVSGGGYFTVERSTDGIIFHPAGTIQIKETSYEPHSYSLKDYTVFTGKSYYRLKLTSSNGLSEYSPIKAVQCNSISDLTSVRLYPNPVKDILHVITSKKIHTLTIKNISGQIIHQFKPDRLNFTFSLKHQPAGLYLVEIKTTDETISVHKILLKKD